ncbi:MAG: hypothetical protein HYZ42_09600 [Bacteroidetes bacterium]|nr:hypothetical protein [Bacteroidota bacterium]
MTTYINNVCGNNQHLLAIYIANYCRYHIENKLIVTKRLATKAGLLSIMGVYKKGIKIEENKEMKKLIKLSNDGKLDDFVRSKF